MKIGILSPKYLNEFNLNVINPIMMDKRFSINLVIIDDKTPQSLLQKFKKNWRKGRGGYIIIMFLQKFISGRKEKLIPAENFFKKHNIKIILTKDIHDKKIIKLIKNHHLDALVLLGGFGIIKKPLLNLVPYGVISYHHGDMRKYRGMPPAFWELYNGEKEMGITVQRLTKGLDCGCPIIEKKIKILPTDTFKSLKERAMKESEDMMYKALIKLMEKEICKGFIQQDCYIRQLGNIYSLPNFRVWFILQIRTFFKILKFSIIKRIIKIFKI